MNHNTKLKHRIIAASLAVLMALGTMTSLAELRTAGTALADSTTTVASGDSSENSAETSDLDYGLQDSDVTIQAQLDAESEYIADGLSIDGDQSAQGCAGDSDTTDVDISPDGAGSKLAQPAAESEIASDDEEIVISKFEDYTNTIECQHTDGSDFMSIDDIQSLLPTYMSVITKNGEKKYINVSWKCDEQDKTEYENDPINKEALTFNVVIPDKYSFTDDFEDFQLPSIIVWFNRDGGYEMEDIGSDNSIGYDTADALLTEKLGDKFNEELHLDEDTGKTAIEALEDDNFGVAPLSNVGDSVYITKGASVAYVGYSTHRYTATINGVSHIAYCAQPEKSSVSGTYTVSKLDKTQGAGREILAIMLRGIGGPLYDQDAWFQPNVKEDTRYGYIHAAIGRIYSGSTKGLPQSCIEWSYDIVNENEALLADKSSTLSQYMEKYDLYVAYNTSGQDIVWFEETPVGYLSLKKNTNTTSIAVSGMYTLNGAVYNVYSDSARSSYVGRLTTDSNGNSTSYLTVNPGAYYVKEVVAPDNYKLNTYAYGGTVSGGTTTTISTWDEPITGSIVIQKRSANTAVTNGNSNYSLQGARYRIYNSSGTLVADQSTDANGYLAVSGLWPDTYTVVEMCASKGYKVNSTKYKVEVSAVKWYSATSGNYKFYARVRKNGWCWVQFVDNGKFSSVSFPTWIEPNTGGGANWLQGTRDSSNSWYAIFYLGELPYGTNMTGTFNVHVYGDGVGAFTFRDTYNLNNPTVYTNGSTVLEQPAQSYIEINKASTNPDVTNNSDFFSLKDAVYGVYTDNACKNQVTTLTTDENGHAKSGLLPINTYYVKEITAPKGFKVDSNVYTVNTTVQNQVYSGAWQSDGHEIATERSNIGWEWMSYRNVDTKYKSVKFAVWSKSDQSDIIWYSAGKDGNETSWGCFIYPGLQSGSTFYHVHVYGYDANGNGTFLGGASHTIDVDFDKTFTLDVKDEPLGGWLEINKSSANTSITDGNNCYTLKGAVYGVYSDKACTKELSRLTTDEKGYAKSDIIPAGTAYLKEITAPTGYELDENVYTITILAAQTIQQDLKDNPANDPVGISLTKIQATPNHNLPSMAGAQFTVKYYDGQYNSVNDLPAKAKRTWVIETKEYTNSKGEVSYRTFLDDDYKAGGDEFYYDSGVATVPIGTITVEETKTAFGYTVEGGYLSSSGQTVDSKNGVILLNITQDGITGGGAIKGGNEYTKQEESDLRSSVTINKKDSNGNALAGAEFSIDIKNIETGEWEHLTDKTTDANGQIVFDNLIFGTYRITETKTTDGKTLLTEPIIVTLPYSSDKAISGLTPTFVRDGVNYYCEVSYDVTNNSTFNLPLTGGTSEMLYTMMSFSLALITGGTFIILKRKKKFNR